MSLLDSPREIIIFDLYRSTGNTKICIKVNPVKKVLFYFCIESRYKEFILYIVKSDKKVTSASSDSLKIYKLYFATKHNVLYVNNYTRLNSIIF